VSKKLPGIRFFPVKLEIPRQPTAIGAQLVQKILSAWSPRNAELACTSDVNLNFVAFLKPQGLHHSRRKADGETVAPFCNLHDLYPMDIRDAECISTVDGGQGR
jgi:hypothetical protein